MEIINKAYKNKESLTEQLIKLKYQNAELAKQLNDYLHFPADFIRDEIDYIKENAELKARLDEKNTQIKDLKIQNEKLFQQQNNLIDAVKELIETPSQNKKNSA